jgi:uncharacterized lipoprotein YddW (UPF0748 family)
MFYRVILSCIVACLALLQTNATTAVASTAEVRGTWLTTTANSAIASPAQTEATMKRLREIGLNVVYIECWKNGYTEYPSQVMNNLVGVPMKINGAPQELQRDLLEEAVNQAHRNQMLAVAWFEYGFMASFKDTDNHLRRLARQRGWLTLTQDGNEVAKSNPFTWLNPLHPEAQQLVIDLVVEAVRKYDLDGIQLDDRIAMPVEMGYDDFTKQLYAQEHGGKMPPADFKDPAWIQWRADKISAFALRFVREVRAANPDLIISVSPAPYRWSLDNYACDWITWTRWCYCGGNVWNEYIPQTYRLNFDATKKSIDEQINHIGDKRDELIAGIRIVGDGPDMTFDDLAKSIQHTRDTKIGGHVLWFSRGVLDVYPEQLKSFYDVANKGHAPHPYKPGDWRTAPIVATKDGQAFVVVIKDQRPYKVLAKVDGVWVERMTKTFEPGTHRLIEGPETTDVEVLVDRRP